MGYNTQALPDYVEQNKSELTAKLCLSGNTISKIATQVGVKGVTQINLLDIDLQTQDGSACTFNAQGGATLTGRNLDSKIMAVAMDFCEKDLRNKWLQEEVTIAAVGGDMPVERKIIDGVISKMQAKIEKTIWNGKVSNGNGEWDGFVNVDHTGMITNTGSKANIYEAAKKAYTALPEDVLDSGADIVMFMASGDYRALVQELVAKNLFHVDAHEGAGEIYLPGTDCKIISTPGLNGTNKIYCSYAENFVFGTDALGDEEKVDFWYSQDSRNYKLYISMNGACNFKFPDLVSEVTLE